MIERFAPGAGGVEGVAWQVAHELAHAGLDVTVLCRETAEHEWKQGEGELAHIRLRVPSFWQPLRVVAFSRATAIAIRTGAFDVVHSFSRTHHQHLYRAGGGSHADYLDRTHAGAARAVRQLSPRHLALLAIERSVFADSDQRIQCASRLVADALVERHGVARERILLLPNAVDTARFASPASRGAGRRLRRQLDEKAERIWLLPGSGWRRKGLDVLLEALARLADPGLRVWVAGRDDPRIWRRRAESLGVSDRLRFLGLRSDMASVYSAVDGMVLPTRYDAFANVTLEAAAAGLAVVTTKSNGAAEWLGEDVLLIDEPGDANGLACAMASLADAEHRRALGARAQRRAQQLDWASHAAALREEYQRIVAARRPGSLA